MNQLLKYFKPYFLPLFLLFILTLGQTYINLTLPDYMARIINEGIVGQQTDSIYRYGLIMLGITAIGGILTIGVGYLAAIIATGFAKKLRNALFTKIEDFSLIEFNKFSTASLITRNTNDVAQIQQALIMLLRLALMAPLMAIIAIVKAYGVAPSMTWIMLVAVGALTLIIGVLFSIAMPQFAKLQKLVDKLNLITREILTGLRVIRAFDKQEYEEKKFARTNKTLTDVNLLVNRLMVVMQPAMILILNATTLAVVWFGAQQIDLGQLEIGNMLAFMQYAMQAIFAFLMISIVFIMVPRAWVSVNRVAEILGAKPTIKDPKNPIRAKSRNGKVEFKNVTFAYKGAEEPILKDVSFVANPGEITAIVGSTGSGKSTLINLIPRFYDVGMGEVLVDEVNVKDMAQKELRSRIGYVSQKAMLFSGSVKQNIAYGKPKASQDKIIQAAQTAQALEFIERLEGKFESSIAQAGSNVSGGQKQRLSIARALAKEPEIYIFDDSFSALDFKTDAALRKALSKNIKNKTILIVAQRISTIAHANKIIVIDEGRIVDQGTHQELLRDSSVYKELAASQLSEAEIKKALKK